MPVLTGSVSLSMTLPERGIDPLVSLKSLCACRRVCACTCMCGHVLKAG